MKGDDYVDMVNGKHSGERAFMTRKLRFKENIAIEMKFRGIRNHLRAFVLYLSAKRKR